MKRNFSGTGAAHIGMFGRTRILMEEEGDKGGGGGGDADAKLEAKIGEVFNKLFHKASTEREARFEKKITKTMGDLLTNTMNEIKGMISDGEDKEDKTPDKKGEGKPGDLPPEIRAQLQRMEQTAKEAKEKADKWEKEANEAKTKAARTEERTQLSALLGGAVKPALADMVVGQLHSRIQRDPDDPEKILFKQDDGTMVPLKDGIDAWKKSDAGKEVAPPRPAGGSGGSGPGGKPSRDPGSFGLEDLGAILTGGSGS